MKLQRSSTLKFLSLMTSPVTVIALTAAATLFLVGWVTPGTIRQWCVILGVVTLLGTVGIVLTVWIIARPASSGSSGASHLTPRRLRKMFVSRLASVSARCAEEVRREATPAQSATLL
jgi:hypothetical protein